MNEGSLVRTVSGITDSLLFAWSGIYNYVHITDIIISPKSATKAWIYYSGLANNLAVLQCAATTNVPINLQTPINIGKDKIWADLRVGTEQNGETNYLINYRWEN